MKMEKRAKVVFGVDGCTLSDLRDALDHIESELGKGCHIKIHSTPTVSLPEQLVNVVAIAGFKMVGTE